jgi:hypothetical protein
MAIEPKILTFGTNKVGTIGGKLMGYTEPPIPLQITDSRLWLNNDLATMTVNGSNRVSQWRDSSGNLNHFSQGTGANQPLFVANGINGQNGVKWSNSSNEWLDCTLGSVINQKYTIITVWNLDASSTQTYPYVYDRNGAIGDRIQLYWFGNNIRIGSPTVVTAYAKTRPFNLMSSEVCYDNTTSKVYQNGVLQATVNSGSSALTSLRLGHLNSTDTLSRLSGYICEVIVYAKELSAGERTLINTYLSTKYGL